MAYALPRVSPSTAGRVCWYWQSAEVENILSAVRVLRRSRPYPFLDSFFFLGRGPRPVGRLRVEEYLRATFFWPQSYFLHSYFFGNEIFSSTSTQTKTYPLP